MHKATSYVLVVVLLGLTGRSWAQYPGMGPPPAFSSEAPPPPPPEFCPTEKPAPRTSTVPFDNISPVGNAFTNRAAVDTFTNRWYFGLGPAIMRRTGLNRGIIAVLEPARTTPNPESGDAPPPTSATITDFQNVPIQFGLGIRGEIGVNFGCNALELSGFYTSTSTSHTASYLGQIDVLFANYPSPIGFTGSGSGGNLWLQADVNTIGYSLTLGNAELNYRYQFARGIEFIGGMRYFDLHEQLNIFTDDDVLRLGTSNPRSQANYAVDVHSRIFAPQVGFELEQILVPIVSFGINGKAAVGPNVLRSGHTIELGNGFQGPGSFRNDVLVSSVFELGLFSHLWFNDQLRLRLGYNFLWVLNIPEAQQQVNFNPNSAAGNVNNGGSMFFSGPIIELQVAF